MLAASRRFLSAHRAPLQLAALLQPGAAISESLLVSYLARYQESLGVALASARREGPEDRNEHAGGNPENQVQWRADLWEISEAITAGAEDIGVGLVSDGRGEAGCATKHDRDGKGSRVQSHRRRDLERDRSQEQSDGVVADQLR